MPEEIQLVKRSESQSSLSPLKTEAQVEIPNRSGIPWQLYLKVIYLGTCFCLIFVGFNVAETFVTTLYPGAFGYFVLFTIYAFFSISSLLAPLMCSAVERLVGDGLGEKFSMFFSSISYFLFVMAVGLRIQWLLIFCSVLIGISAGLLWNAEGVWLTRTVNDYLGLLPDNEDQSKNVIGTATGIFFTINNINGIVGNAVAIGVLSGIDGESSLGFVIWIMAGITGVGALSLLGTPACQPRLNWHTDSNRRSLMEEAKSFWEFVRRPQVLLLTPYYFSEGINFAYNFGNFPLFVTFVMRGTDESDSRGISIVFLGYSAAAFAGSFIWGRLYDYYNSSLIPLLTCHTILAIFEFGLLLGVVLAPIEYPLGMYPALILVGISLGLMDYLTNALINNCNSNKFPAADTSKAFAWYRFVYCIGFCLTSGVSAAIPGIDAYHPGLSEGIEKWGWIGMIIYNVFFAIVAIGCALYLELFHYRKQD